MSVHIKTQTRVAFDLIHNVFKDKIDKGGNAYVNHPIRVAENIFAEKEKKCNDNTSTLSLFYDKAYIVALLHDVVEDTDITLEDLRNKYNFDEEIVNAVDAISRRDNEKFYFDFIERVGKNDIAKLVKIYDLEDNMDIRRLKTFGETDQQRLKKYWYCWKYLKGEINSVSANNTIHPNRLYR